MKDLEISSGQELTIRPAASFAFLNILPLVLFSAGILFLAWYLFPGLVCISVALMGYSLYRYIYIRRIRYILTTEMLKVNRGIFFKRCDLVELYRVKDYVVTQSFLLQMLGLMDLMLKTTDSENPVVWMRGIPLSNLVDTIRDGVQSARQHNKIVEIIDENALN